MKTRENKAMRFASVLLVLTLLATSLTAGTFAKYTTGAEGAGKARVAKFGVDVSVDTSQLFGEKYGANDAIVTNVLDTGITVQADTAESEKKVVAPGTSGSMTFTIKGNPETKVNLKVDMTGSDGTGDVKEVMLAEGTYKNGNAQESKSVTVGAGGYYPVKWTLKKITTNNPEGEVVGQMENKKLSEIESYLETTFSKEYAPNTLNTVEGKYTLSWKWDFDTEKKDGANDGADTILGDLAAEDDISTVIDGAAKDKIDPSAYSLNEEFKLTISVTQED